MMSVKCLLLCQSDGESVSGPPLGDSSGNAGLTPAGNPRLRNIGVLEVRRLLRKELIGDPAAKAAWDAYEAEWHERERTYAAAGYRAFERGERGGWR